MKSQRMPYSQTSAPGRTGGQVGEKPTGFAYFLSMQPSHQMLGQLIGGYELVGVLGSGGMGTVFRALDGAGDAVALKLLHPGFNHDAEARARVSREVATLHRVRGANIARVLDAEVDGDHAFIVTELIDGVTLDASVADQGPLSIGELNDLATGIAAALGSIHVVGVIHRDLKPSNVMLTDDGPVLIDFGISQGLEDARITRTGLVTGTPGYVDPVLINGGSVTESVDWWGWGALLIFAATGRAPFGGGPWQTVLSRVMHGQPDVGGLPNALAEVLTAALRPEVAQRETPARVLERIDQLAGWSTSAAKDDHAAAFPPPVIAPGPNPGPLPDAGLGYEPVVNMEDDRQLGDQAYHEPHGAEVREGGVHDARSDELRLNDSEPVDAFEGTAMWAATQDSTATTAMGQHAHGGAGPMPPSFQPRSASPSVNASSTDARAGAMPPAVSPATVPSSTVPPATVPPPTMTPRTRVMPQAESHLASSPGPVTFEPGRMDNTSIGSAQPRMASEGLSRPDLLGSADPPGGGAGGNRDGGYSDGVGPTPPSGWPGVDPGGWNAGQVPSWASLPSPRRGIAFGWWVLITAASILVPGWVLSFTLVGTVLLTITGLNRRAWRRRQQRRGQRRTDNAAALAQSPWHLVQSVLYQLPGWGLGLITGMIIWLLLDVPEYDGIIAASAVGATVLLVWFIPSATATREGAWFALEKLAPRRAAWLWAVVPLVAAVMIVFLGLDQLGQPAWEPFPVPPRL